MRGSITQITLSLQLPNKSDNDASFGGQCSDVMLILEARLIAWPSVSTDRVGIGLVNRA